jgi:hypothetical protein
MKQKFNATAALHVPKAETPIDKIVEKAVLRSLPQIEKDCRNSLAVQIETSNFVQQFTGTLELIGRKKLPETIDASLARKFVLGLNTGLLEHARSFELSGLDTTVFLVVINSIRKLTGLPPDSIVSPLHNSKYVLSIEMSLRDQLLEKLLGETLPAVVGPALAPKTTAYFVSKG